MILDKALKQINKQEKETRQKQRDEGLIFLPEVFAKIAEFFEEIKDAQITTKDLLSRLVEKEYPKFPEFPKVQKVRVENQTEFPPFPEFPKSDNKDVLKKLDVVISLLWQIADKNFILPKEEKVGLFGSITSKMQVRREMAKVMVRETPRGTIDGNNKDFYLSRAPFGDFLVLVLNDRSQTSVEDYTLTGNKISYVTAPRTGSKHEAQFF